MIKYTLVSKPKRAEIFLSHRITGTHTVPAHASPNVLSLYSTPHTHNILQAGLYPDAGHSIAAVQEQDPGLRWQFSLIISHILYHLFTLSQHLTPFLMFAG